MSVHYPLHQKNYIGVNSSLSSRYQIQVAISSTIRVLLTRFNHMDKLQVLFIEAQGNIQGVGSRDYGIIVIIEDH